jgi:hypothetical protein
MGYNGISRKFIQISIDRILIRENQRDQREIKSVTYIGFRVNLNICDNILTSIYI